MINHALSYNYDKTSSVRNILAIAIVGNQECPGFKLVEKG